MDNKYRYLLKNTGILTIGTFSSKILVFLLVPLYTSVLSTAEYGSYDLVTTTMQLLLPLLSVNIIEAITRYAIDTQYDKKNVFLIGFKYVFLSIAIIGCLVGINSWGLFWKDIAGYGWLIILYYVTYVLYQFLIQFCKGIEKVKEIAIAGVISTIGIIAFNILFLLIFDFRLAGFFGAYIIGQALACIYLLNSFPVVEYFRTEKNRALEKEMILYALPLTFNSLSWWINNASDRYVVTGMCGIDANGIYSVSYKIPVILNTVQSIFIQSWQISALKEYGKDKSEEFYSETFRFISFLMCLSCAVLIALTKVIARFMFAKDFYAAWQYVPFLLISIVINSASGILGPILSAQKKTKEMGISAVCGASINLVLNIILILVFGVQGAAIATMVSSFVIFGCRRYFLKDYHLKDSCLVYISWILLIIQAYAIIYTKQYWIQILIVACVLCVFKNDILKFYNILRKRVK